MHEQSQSASSSTIEFPLFAGGPFYRQLHAILPDRTSHRRTGIRVLVLVLIAWVPMALLAAVQGFALGPTRMESFLMDFAINVRQLITMPVLILAETYCAAQLTQIVQQFLNARLLETSSRARFETNVEETIRLSHSGLAEAVLLGLSYVSSAGVLIFVLNYPDPTWRTPVINGHHVLSLAGGWHFGVAYPFFAFLLSRWLWRLGLWWRFLWRTSRLDLHLTPSHADQAGGLGFLSSSLQAFSVFAFGMSAQFAGILADFVVYEGHSPLEYQWAVALFVALMVVLIVGPLLHFLPQLFEAKDKAIVQYGALASRQIQHVEEKWLTEGIVPEDSESSMPDFRSVTHVGHSVSAVHKMGLIPLSKEEVLQLLIFLLLPFVPLLVTQVPMGEILSLLLKVVA
jgi:hypothetical protein